MLSLSHLLWGNPSPTDIKCIEPVQIMCFGCAEWFKLQHTYKSCVIFVKDSPKWDNKPFCTPCKQKKTLSSQEVEVCCKTSCKVQKSSESPRKPTQQKISLFSTTLVFQHGLLISFSIYPSHKTHNKAPYCCQSIKRYKYAAIQLSWKVQVSPAELRR